MFIFQGGEGREGMIKYLRLYRMRARGKANTLIRCMQTSEGKAGLNLIFGHQNQDFGAYSTLFYRK